MLVLDAKEREDGLSTAAAARRLHTEGPNELPTARRRTTLVIAWEVVHEPMFLLLVAAGTLYLFLGDLREALVLLGSVVLVMGITIAQERRTERALEALRDLSSPRALVIRYGQRVRIRGREGVRGDLVLLAEGDRVPADAIVDRSSNLSVDESLLTGERKRASATPATDPGHWRTAGGSVAECGCGRGVPAADRDRDRTHGSPAPQSLECSTRPGCPSLEKQAEDHDAKRATTTG